MNFENGTRRRRHLHRWHEPSLVVELQPTTAVGPGPARPSDDDLGDGAAAAALCRCTSAQALEAMLQSMLLGKHDGQVQGGRDGDVPPASRSLSSQAQQQPPQPQLPDLFYPPRHEIAWLSCRRRRRRRKRNPPSGEAPPSIMGLVEDLEEEGDNDDEDPSRCSSAVSLRHWKFVVSSTAPPSHDGAVAPVDDSSGGTSSPGQDLTSRPTADWSRKGKHLDYVPPSHPRSNPDTPWKIDVVDLLPAPELLFTKERPKAADVYHFLRSLLSPANSHSPWTKPAVVVSDDAEGCLNDAAADQLDVVLLLLPAHAPLASVLQEFRLADACPAWYLHSVATLSKCHNSVSAARCLVYRRMPPRVALSSVHWETLEPVPVPGCLWEWHSLPKSDEEGKGKSNGATGNDDGVVADDEQEQEEPKHVVRLVGPPFFDALAEYPELQVVLDHLDVIREEARTISQWTAWPEEQHYSAGADDDDNDGDGSDAKSVPWTVFPLCYCFPADDESKRSWVGVMSRAVPRTTALLQRPELRRLRTALFSRLAPGARLFAHTGWSDLANHVLRVHVPVLLPPASAVQERPERSLCGLWVDGVVQTLAPNELVCFDDSKMHWAFNYDNQERVVLILDFERPAELPPGTATGGHTEELDRFILQAQGLPY